MIGLAVHRLGIEKSEERDGSKLDGTEKPSHVEEFKQDKPVKPLRVDGEDFTVSYDPEENRWLAKWRWSENELEMLKNSVGE